MPKIRANLKNKLCNFKWNEVNPIIKRNNLEEIERRERCKT